MLHMSLLIHINTWGSYLCWRLLPYTEVARLMLVAQVPFDKPMQPAGNVEFWLGEVERRMLASVRTQVRRGGSLGL
jgi:hypothetical protein